MEGVILLLLKSNIPPPERWYIEIQYSQYRPGRAGIGQYRPGRAGIEHYHTPTEIKCKYEISALLYNNVNMLTLPSGTGKYTAHGPHYAALGSHYAALGPRPNGLRPSGGIMGPSGSIMFGLRAVYFPVSLGQGQHIIPLNCCLE